MPKIDKIKIDIAFREKLFFGSMVGKLVLIIWVVSNYKTTDWWLLAVSLVIVIGATFFGLGQYRRIKSLIQELGSC